MRILLLIGFNFYNYQQQILKEILNLDEIEVYVLQCDYDPEVLIEDKFSKFINSKFPVFKKNPFSYQDSGEFINNSKLLLFNEELDYNYVINFCNSDIITEHKIKFDNILKLDIDQNSWFAASIRGLAFTTINILKSSDNQNFALYKSLSFDTEISKYNNKYKALYYFSYLVKSIFSYSNYQLYDVGKKINFNILDNWIYNAKLIKIILSRKFSKTQLNWKIAVLKNNIPTIVTDQVGAFWADPFVIMDSDNKWVFFEEFDFQNNLGKISLINLKENIPSHKEVVLQKPFHLSFPNVFKIENDFYMLPEESASYEQNIYKALDFPYRWEKHITIFKNKKVVDPVFILYNQKYWLFFNEIEDFEYDNNERLYLYYSNNLFSEEWVSHPQNPVIIDKSKARNAGNIFRENDHYVRVSQDCQKNYGTSISKNKIEELSEKIYREKQLVTKWNFDLPYGFHTINTQGDTTVIDLLVKESKQQSQKYILWFIIFKFTALYKCC